ncbi:hypothetical protein GCM10011515_11140 [Tsuneonella deserti]|uniref:Lipoprotein n=1 Tax=Tsuneonella deserti TaxID=2035528 RepID=A0ABQ1S505_9SPHN|nr:hypothetical protein [Tsuneonella deserti]GGD93141.1 hypothetical protein GCM10011515_11140 [Tsuneonella deserti]
MRAAAALLAAMLAACSQQPGQTPRETADVGPGPLAETNAQPVKASEGDLTLTPLSPEGGKAIGLTNDNCRYAYQGRTLLIAGSGKAVVVLDGSTVMLKADASDDLAYSGEGINLAIEPAEGSNEPLDSGKQSPADLKIGGSKGEAEFSAGTWTCSS